METSAKRLENNKVEVTVTVDAKDVDKAIAGAYKDMANKYRFPGFRPGHAPRPVINSQIGRTTVMAQATEQLVNEVEPAVRNAEDIVAVGDPRFPEPAMVEDKQDFTFKVVYTVPPVLTLTSCEPVEITLPSEEATEAEIDRQVETFRGYFGKYVDIEGRSVQDDDFVYIKCEGGENAENLKFENRLYKLGGGAMPEGFDKGLLGMNPGDQKTIEFELPQPEAAEGEEAPEVKVAKVDVTLNRLVEHTLPELTDEFAKKNFGFDDVAAMREAIGKEISTQKQQAIPQIKENRVTGALAERLEGEPTPEFTQTVFQELGQNFLNQLQRQGVSLDVWLRMNGIDSQTFMSDLQRQATDIARESLALDALVADKGFDCTDEDVDEEFKKSGVEDWESVKEQFNEEGRMPAIRVSIRRNKAIDWLLETAIVTISDEPEPAKGDDADKAEEKPAKKTTKKRTTKKAAEEGAAEGEAEEKPAPKKRTTKKAAADKAEEGAEGEEKPAPKKRTTKKTTKKADEATEDTDGKAE